MRVLVDTSVWIDHLHRSNPGLQAHLTSGHVWTHAVIIGELATGRLRQRDELLLHLKKLPRGDEIDLDEGLHLIAEHRLWGRGLSWADIQLLAAARLDRLVVWTSDRALAAAARELGLGYTEKT